MHESKGQHIGKAPSLHLFTADAMQLDHISLVPEPTCGRRKMAWGEAKTMAMYFNNTIISLQSTPTHLKLLKRFRITQWAIPFNKHTPPVDGQFG